MLVWIWGVSADAVAHDSVLEARLFVNDSAAVLQSPILFFVDDLKSIGSCV